MANDANKPVSVNGASSGVDPQLQSDITRALIQNGGIKHIQDSIRQALDEEGWSQDLREYATRLFRSGEATTYPEAEKKIYQLINSGAKGTTAGVADPDLRLPQSAKERGVEVVKKELQGVCKWDK
jgi:hypothetical protein